MNNDNKVNAFFITIAVTILAIVYGYVANMYFLVSDSTYQTLNVPNVVCGAGIFIPPVGVVCGIFRTF